MTNLRLVIVLGLLLVASRARAQDEPPPGPSGGTITQADGLSAWSTSVADNPFTLNSGMLEVHAALPVFLLGVPGVNAMGMPITVTDTFVLAGGGVSYGISNDLEVGGDLAIALAPNAGLGALAGHVAYRIYNKGKISAAVGAALVFSDSAKDFFIAAGGSFRYRFTKQWSIYTTTGALPSGCGECLHVAGPVTGQFLVQVPTSGGGSTQVQFGLPVGVGFQATNALYLYASLVLLDVGSTNTVIGRDYFPLTIGGWYALSNKLRLGLNIFDDFEHAGNAFEIEGMIKIYVGG